MKTTTKMLKTLLLVSAVFLTSNQMIAQTNTSPTQTVCAGSTAEPYLINPPTAGSTYQWTLTGGGTIVTGQGTNSITIDWGPTAGGPHTLDVLETNGGCSSALVTLDVTIVDGPTAIAGANGDVCVGDPFVLSGNATNQVSVLWTTSGDGAFTNISSLNPDYTPGPNDLISGSVDLTLTVTGNSPCVPIPSTMTLTVIPNPIPGPIYHN